LCTIKKEQEVLAAFDLCSPLLAAHEVAGSLVRTLVYPPCEAGVAL
jgi:hypothetical protein